MFSAFETSLMKRLIRKASQFKGKTFPNPVVSAAVYRNETVIAEGVHKKPGTPHAECHALDKAGSRAKGASLMVTLSPCTHHGKTPPCTQKIIDSGIKSVVFAVKDPNPLVSQRDSKAQLEAHQITVRQGLCQPEAIQLNAGFFSLHQRNCPWVHLKVGMSLDGGIALASGESKYITSHESLKNVHRLRRMVQAVVVGVNTVIQDNPSLNVRYGLCRSGYQQPWRIILDTNGRIPINATVLQETVKQQTIVCVSKQCPIDKKNQLSQLATVWEISIIDGQLDWKQLLKQLGEIGVQEILIEGGQRIFTSAMAFHVVDQCHFFVAPTLLGSPGMMHPFNFANLLSLDQRCQLYSLRHLKSGNDIYITGYVSK